jgi:hypothetical protein
MHGDQQLDGTPVATLGRASVEGWLAALDAGLYWNRTATAELLALLESAPADTPPTRLLADTVAETAETADAMARAQQTCWYLTGATLFGMAPRKERDEPIRLDVDG